MLPCDVERDGEGSGQDQIALDTRRDLARRVHGQKGR